MPTNSQKTNSDIVAMLRSGVSIIWIETKEEERIEDNIRDASDKAGFDLIRHWDCGQGLMSDTGEDLNKQFAQTYELPDPSFLRSPESMLQVIMMHTRRTAQRLENQRDENGKLKTERGLWVMRDLGPWLNGAGSMAVLRSLCNVARCVPTVDRRFAQTIVVLGVAGEIPAELEAHAAKVTWPLPDASEISALIDAQIEVLPDEWKADALPDGTRSVAIESALGLTAAEISRIIKDSLVRTRSIDTDLISVEKKRIIGKSGLISFFDPLPGGLDSIGGLDLLKAWIKKRILAYSPAARAYGLPSPRGFVLIGPPGTGKSLASKAMPTALRCQLVKVDLGALQSKYVGESQRNMRTVYALLDAMGLCVAWYDEIDKAMAGAINGAADGGVSADALGSMLTWMQEKKSPTFVTCTANDYQSLPAELLRKGRFDEVFFLDLPNPVERAEILKVALRSKNRQDLQIAIPTVVEKTKTFTGSEIAALVEDAMFYAFSDNQREITTDDLVAMAELVVPLAKQQSDKIAKMREWANGKARPASTRVEESVTASKPVRGIDIS